MKCTKHVASRGKVWPTAHEYVTETVLAAVCAADKIAG
jgi:hypothetical protein